MFNLEQAIAEWRKRMRAAGIQSPVPLEELEEHLREEIEAQVNLGRSEAAAFEVAAQNIGPARGLKAEFNRSAGWLGWLGDDRATQINRILGLGWMGGSLWDLQFYTRTLADFLYFPLFSGMRITTANSGLMQGEMALDLAGVVAGFYLFRGTKPFRWIVWVLAGLQLWDTASDLAWVSAAGGQALPWYWNLVSALEISFLLSTLWLLRPRRKSSMAAR